MLHPGWVNRDFWLITWGAANREVAKQSWRRWYTQQRRALAYRREHGSAHG